MGPILTHITQCIDTYMAIITGVVAGIIAIVQDTISIMVVEIDIAKGITSIMVEEIDTRMDTITIMGSVIDE